MRLIGAASTIFALTLATAMAVSGRQHGGQDRDRGPHNGQSIFRFDTFGDEQLWTDTLQMQVPLSSLAPATALEVGLKVDVDALPPSIVSALQAGLVDLEDPAITLALLQLDAVVGVKGQVSDGQLTRVGITCALCHSSVDNSLLEGIGHRLDGWANTDLDVGAIVALSPVLPPGLKTELRTWGPGKYDPRHHAFDGLNIIPLNTPSSPIVIPPIYGLENVGFETFTGDGPISYWNAYVGVSQMGGHGSFSDPRLPMPPITQTPDLVTPKLPALLDYQLSLRTPEPPAGSVDRRAAKRGERLFKKEAGCASCHRSPAFTDVLHGPHGIRPFLHDPAEVGADATYALRSATGKYRTTPLRALWQHAPYFHDGSAPDLLAVVNHYDTLFGLNLTQAQKADLVEFLKSI